MPDLTTVLQYLANGVAYGAILALAAIGLSLVYGILNLSSFAHGDFLTLGAFGALLAARMWFDSLDVILLAMGVALLLAAVADQFTGRRLSVGERSSIAGAGLVALVLGILLTMGVGMNGRATTNLVLIGATVVSAFLVIGALLAFEFAVWRPLRKRRATTLTLIIVSIGVALVVRNALLLRFGGGLHSYARPGSPSPTYFGVRISEAEQATFLIAILLIAGVHFFLRYTRAGKAMRALADNQELARVSGVNVDRMVLYVWVLSGVLLAVGGVLLALVRNNAMDAQMGGNMLIALFAAVIVGGIGSAYGAMLGGFIIGIAMKTTPLWIGSEYELAAAFMALIVVLIVRPQGLLGVKG
ncbi:MAG TPA: branched-chain amino acid ABC transporter permease [Candidatus Thermoplasmatota archaeon]|nr:branched-chain amino acid ABC transporter permease [Candidatus Thermoplasmatota archaeon]